MPNIFFPQEPTCLIPAMHVKAWDGSNGTNVKNGFYGQDTEAVAAQDANQSPYGFETMNVTVQVGCRTMSSHDMWRSFLM